MGAYKIINDPVHGTIKLKGPLLDLASTPELNRLNQIRQLGLAYLVFPGAHHTRFEHSLGVSHVAGFLGKAIDIDPEEIKLVQTAGLLHDLGHGPFSHTMEKVFFDRLGKEHMALTSDIITGSSDDWTSEWLGERERGPSIPEILETHCMEPKEVAALICQKERPSDVQETLQIQNGQAFFHGSDYLYQIIHSALDADQLDFLLRDSHYTGVAYGIIDLDRIVNTATLFHGELMIEKRGISALEGMLVARSLMYSSVYFHKTARIAESMLCRAGEYLTEEALMSVWKMSDGEILRFMKDQGGLAGEIASRLRFRQLFKSAFRIESEDMDGDGDDALRKRELIRVLSIDKERKRMESEIAIKAGLDEGKVIIDVPDPSLTLSEPRLRRTDIKVLGNRPEILSSISSLARALQRRPPIPWCMMISCPGENLTEVRSASKGVVESFDPSS
jgi:HD superfamily phosphohydrolase